ncbi:MAG: DOMON-like domain-containing protein [Pseudomonadota bacterium]|nr:DOMON-like domain-containing protein [Pseudomonadota bacterium]
MSADQAWRFSLVPDFPLTDRAVQLEVIVTPQPQCCLQVDYILSDPDSQVLWPATMTLPRRLDFLWEHTCLELFIKTDEQPDYVEINASPCGAWQAYRFDDYRSPKHLPPNPDFRIRLQRLSVYHHHLRMQLDLSRLVKAGQMLQIGTCAVLEHNFGSNSYWALRHSALPADFHRQQDWMFQLAVN